ncbi:MAG: SDR family oxidoreductase [Bdellovibrionota bacterium]
MSSVGKKHVILGASGSTGHALTLKLLAEGAQVFGIVRNRASIEDLEAQFPDRFRYAVWSSDEGPEALKVLIDEAAAWQSTPLSGLVVAVGSILIKPAHLTRESEWQETLLLNLTIPFWAARSTLPYLMTVPGASMVFFSSVAAHVGLPNHEAIAAAKAGLEGLVRSLAATYASKGVRINAIAPSLTRSKMSSRFGEAVFKASERTHPLGRVGSPEDLALAARFLLSEDASWITGQVLGVDGGMSALRSLG